MDESSFPVLVGTALPTAVKFVLDQLGAFLDRRRLRQAGGPDLENHGIVDLPEFVKARGPRQLDDAEIDAHFQEIEMLHALLRLSSDQRDLDGAEPRLRILLARAKTVLEAIYHQDLNFVVDDKEAVMVVTHRVDDVDGDATGLDAKTIARGGRADVEQNVKRVHETGTATAAKVERLG